MKKILVILVILLFFSNPYGFAGAQDESAKPENTDTASQTAIASGEAGVRKEYLAEQKVRSLPSTHGDTIDSYMTNMAKIPNAKDLGWKVYTLEDGYEVERSISMNNRKIFRYKWKVLHSGEVIPMDDGARSLMK